MAAGIRPQGRSVRQRRSRWSGGLQALALACFLSLWLWPLLWSAFQGTASGAGCSGDHRICGCSPHRVATKSCCCYQVPECCRKESHLDAEGPRSDHASSASLASLPCGRPSPLMPFPQDSNLLLPPRTIQEVVIVPRKVRYAPFDVPLPEHFHTPPVPPPRLVFFA